jgi:hypothetical protein
VIPKECKRLTERDFSDFRRRRHMTHDFNETTLAGLAAPGSPRRGEKSAE